MNVILQLLTSLAGINYQATEWQKLIAVVKANTTLDDAAKQEFIDVANKALNAENQRNAAVSALLTKYNNADNIEAQADDDDDNSFF